MSVRIRVLTFGDHHEHFKVRNSSRWVRLTAPGRHWCLDPATARAFADALHDHADAVETRATR